MRHVKITDAKGQTKNHTQWGEGVTHEAKQEGKQLCSAQVLHGYVNAYVAVFFNPIHGNYDPKTMLLWEAEGEVVANDGTKLGFKRQTTIRPIPITNMTIEQKVKIAILASLEVYKEASYVKWAHGWLNNVDRSYKAAYHAADAADDAAYAAYHAAYNNINVIAIINKVMEEA